MNNKKIMLPITVIIIVLCIILISTYIKFLPSTTDNNQTTTVTTKAVVDNNTSSDFNDLIIKESYRNENYLISPYSIEVALKMLMEGANDNTKNEISSIIGNRESNINNDNIKIANATFIKNNYKELVENNFTSILENKYKSEMIYSDYTTPDVINNWVKNKTDNMIEKVIEQIDENFVLGIINAIAIDAKWVNSFECINTNEEKFTNGDKSLQVEMMHQTFTDENVKYIKDENIESILLPYKENIEFIAIKPNIPLENYISNLSVKNINDMLENAISATSDKKVALSLPRFSYKYEYKEFKDGLINLGIKDAFDEIKADFTNIISKENMEKNGIGNIYVSKAVHKTNIDLNETGTKAAAVTYFEVSKNTAIEEPTDIITIEFNKPFIYIIRDTNTKEILFFGSVYEPNIWQGSSCENIE